jgi:hypothetical protein
MKEVRSRLWLVLMCSLALTISSPLTAQVVKGSISGTVVDPQGAVVSGATVKATSIQAGTSLVTTSDGAGIFRFNLISAGEYKLEISAPGFSTATVAGITVAAARDSGVGTISLSLGQASTTLEVTAGAPIIETTQSQVTNTFSGVQLSTFAGLQENEGLDNLALFVPGVISSRDNNFSNTNGGLGFAVNGIRGRNNDQQIDGQNNNDNSVTGPALFLTDPEFVQQYVLVSNQFGPEYGRNSGSVVNVVTKAGGNAWHGSIFADENNSILNSRTNFQKNPFQAGAPSPINQLPRANDELGGFTVGGPAIKNKLFVFGGFDEGIVSASNLFVSNALTPTPAGLATLAGCFPGNTNLNALSKFGPFGISAGNPQVNGTPQTGVVAACPAAEFSGVSRLLPQPTHLFNWIARTDLQLGNDTLTGRYIFSRNNFFDLESGRAAGGYPVNILALAQDVLLSWTHNFSPHMVNEGRVSFGRTNVSFAGNQIGNTIPTVGNLDNALTDVVFLNPALAGFGVPAGFPQGRIVNTWQAQDNWNYLAGRHQLKAGVNYTYQRSPDTFLPLINGVYVFTGWDSFFSNAPLVDQIEEGPATLDFREHDTFLYAGDDWKLTPNLTLNLGLTWTYYGQPANLLHDLDVANQKSATPFFNPALGLAVNAQPLLDSQKTLFGPSIGFAYSPHWGGFLTGHGKTVIRGGYRLLYDPPFYNIYSNVAGSAPQVFSQNIFTGPGVPAAFNGPAVRQSLAPLLPLGVLDPRTQNEQTIPANFGADKVHNWSFGVEREVSKNAALEIRYVGTHGSNLFQTVNANPFIGALAADFPSLIPAGVTPCPASQAVVSGAIGRVNCNQGVNIAVANTGYSDYNGLQLEFRANNLFKQLTIRTSYAFSKALDNTSEIFSTQGAVGVGAGNTVTIAQNPLDTQHAERAISGLNIPQQWTVLFTEELPFFRAQHGWVGHILGGWSIAGNYVMASGQPYTPITINFATCSNPANPFCAPGGAGDYFDQRGFNASDNGIEPARPFFGNPKAPATSVGAFAGDACQNGFAAACALPVTQLVSVAGLNNNQLIMVTNQQVRFILNGFEAQQVFGTPFGNVPRNALTDAISNIGNVSFYKQVKFNERASFTFHATMLNVFNHPNFLTVDPVLTDAGLTGAQLGFGQPNLTNDNLPGTNVARRIIFGGKFTF